MIINNVVNQQNLSQNSQKLNSNLYNDSVSFTSIMQSQTEQAQQTDAIDAKDRDQTDFTNMTRQELFDWMNNQIRNGKMTLDESSPFLGMTMKISVETGRPINMATDPTRINFIERARLGVDGALSRNDQQLANRLQTVLDIMQKHLA